MIDSIGGDETVSLRRHRDRCANAILKPIRNYPRQVDVVKTCATEKMVVVQANRRGGKTTAISALIESRVIAKDNFVVRVITHRYATPSRNWLNCSDKESLLKRLKRLGLWEHVRIDRVKGAIKTIRFSWGSIIDVHQCATQEAIDDLHGFSAHMYWADEAQSISHLPTVIGEVILPTLADNGGVQIILSGTPGREVGSYFHKAVTGAKWISTSCYSWNNPIFGDTDVSRWHNIVDTIFDGPGGDRYSLSEQDIARIRALTPVELESLALGDETGDLKDWVKNLDATLRRQYFGSWVVGGAEYIFEWHRAQDLYWGRSTSDGPSDVPILPETISGRINHLPTKSTLGRERKLQWRAVVGCDIGWNPSSTAIVVMVWCNQLSSVYVLWSEAAFEQRDDVTAARLAEIVSELRINGVIVNCVVADVNGTRKGTGATWNHKFTNEFGRPTQGKLWVLEANKDIDKLLQIRTLNLQLLRGQWKFVHGGPVDIEGRYLRWKSFDPDRPKPPKIDKGRMVTFANGTTARPGDHALDAWRYGAVQVPILQFVPDSKDLSQDEWLDMEYQNVRRNEGMIS